MNDAVNYVDLFGLTSNDICYTVQPGDCVWKIADKYDCTTQQVIDNNNFSNPNLIHPGDKIYIPVATPATATDTGSTISVATPSNSVSSGNSSNGSGAGNASMGGGTGLSNIASSMYAAASMNNAASATVTAQASPEIHNAAAEPTLLEKAHNILDILGCFSDIPDGINALLYLYEGNQKEAALCAICFLPFGDAISKGRKVALNAIPEVVEFAGKHGDEAVDAVKVTRKKALKGGNSYSKSFMNGKAGETELAKMFGGKSQAYFKTTNGARYIDQLADGVAHESKVGYTSLTQFVKKQVLKDAEILERGGVDDVVWHFFQSGVTGKVGPSQPLADFLTENGLKYVIH